MGKEFLKEKIVNITKGSIMRDRELDMLMENSFWMMVLTTKDNYIMVNHLVRVYSGSKMDEDMNHT